MPEAVLVFRGRASIATIAAQEFIRTSTIILRRIRLRAACSKAVIAEETV